MREPQEVPKLTPAQAERFWSKVRKADPNGGGCWIWLGTTVQGGYGRFGVGGKAPLAHRVSYVLAFGPVPCGLFVCHHCDNPPCVRPDHLFAGTLQDNVADMVRKGRANNGYRNLISSRPRGERHPQAKLTAETVVAIRREYAEGRTYREIAARFGVGRSSVCSAVRGETWRHV